MTTENIVLAIAGLAMIGLGAMGTFNEAFARAYMQKSPKAFIWRKLLGEERAVVAMRRFFGPLAMVLGVVFISIAVLSSSQ